MSQVEGHSRYQRKFPERHVWVDVLCFHSLFFFKLWLFNLLGNCYYGLVDQNQSAPFNCLLWGIGFEFSSFWYRFLKSASNEKDWQLISLSMNRSLYFFFSWISQGGQTTSPFFLKLKKFDAFIEECIICWNSIPKSPSLEVGHMFYFLSSSCFSNLCFLTGDSMNKISDFINNGLFESPLSQA